MNPVDAASRLIGGAAGVGERDGRQLDEPVRAADGACAVNVGTFRAGDWPSSVPGQAALGIRVGFPPAWTPDEALKRVSDAVSAAAAADPWLASTRRSCARRVSGPRATCSTPGIRWRPAGRRARGRARRAAAAVRAGQHHRRADLPEPVRRARAGLRPAAATSTPRRGGRTGQHRGRGPHPGPLPRRLYAAGGLAGGSCAVSGERDHPRRRAAQPDDGPHHRGADRRTLRHRDRAGPVRARQRLPTERELAAMLGVSRATVREAIARLAESGYVTVRRGRSGGTFVESAGARTRTR